MSHITNKLTAQQVKNTTFTGKAVKLSDGEGLYLHVKEPGRYWRMKYRFAGKERTYSIGVYPQVSLAEARQERQKAKELLRKNIDPTDYKKAAKASLTGVDTFETVAREWYEAVHKHKVVPAHSARNLRRLANYVFPTFGKRPISSITPKDCLDLIKQIEDRGTIETAKRVKSLCGQIFRYGIPTGRVERDPTADLKDLLRKPKVVHYPAVTSPEEIAPLLRAMDYYQGHPSTYAALQLSALLFVRPGELRTAKWADFNLKTQEWEYKPSKDGVPMITPLPTQAIAILEKQRYISDSSEYVFPSVRSRLRPMSDNTVNGALQRLGYKGIMTAHGFRAMARTVLAERLHIPIEYIEMQLGHRVRDANGRAYNRTTYLEQRKDMLQRWADYLDQLRK